MEHATAAMEKVPLTTSADAEPAAEAPIALEAPDDDTPSEVAHQVEAEGPPSIFDRFLLRVHSVFYRFCHSLGAFFLWALAHAMLLAGVVAAVILQLLAYYYTGVLNPWVLLACLFYAPTLGSVAVIREEMRLNGTSRSGVGPRMSQFVTFAYLVLTVAGLASLFQPLALHGDNQISVKSMWTSIGGTALFYYCVLISEVLFAAALNVKRSNEYDEELRRRDEEDPAWMRYHAIEAGRVVPP